MNIDPFDDIGYTKVNGAYCKDFKQSFPVPVANPEERIFFVHAAASMGARGCPIEVLSYVMEKYPMQVFQRDELGHLPLHVAIQKVTWSKHRKRRLKPKEKPFLESLLNAYPGSARERIHTDHHRYPLHSAIANGHLWSQGVREIFLTAPECVIVRDPCTGLYPFQLAGVPIVEEKSYSNDNLETVFQLLRARPDVISYLQEAAEHKKEYEQAHYVAKYSTSKRMLFEARTSKHIVFDVLWDASMTHLDALFRWRKCLYKTRQ
mmetsp:Transcript_8978/g.18652  ORF Transcript_8978/g.18652 Transcript_8978/m.18652 type:complete len:263 (+) Transcript_8978:1-789(+)